MKRKTGFTLIELLTVVMILGILTAIALPQYRQATERANAANALINVRSLFDAAKRYYSSRSYWPTSLTGLDVTLMLNPGSTNQSGEFEYTFDAANRTVTATRIIGNTAGNSYSLTAAYSSGGKRDVFTCTYVAAKYQKLCENMGSCSGSTCTIQ